MKTRSVLTKCACVTIQLNSTASASYYALQSPAIAQIGTCTDVQVRVRPAIRRQNVNDSTVSSFVWFERQAASE